MSAQVGVVGAPVIGRSPARPLLRDRWFFTGMAVVALLTVFIGFARSYYLAGYFGARPLSGLVHLHGILFTAWILLFLTQTSLIAGHRADLHRRLGVVGGTLAVLMLVVGYLVAVQGAKRGLTPPGGPPPLVFMAIPFGALVAFIVLVGTGLYYRRRSEIHKRLMLLGTIAILTPAIARMTFITGGGPRVAMIGTCLLAVVCMVYDRLAHGRVHPAFLWGGLFLIASLPLRVAFAWSSAWRSIAVWLTS
jgi:hypothetical protein